MARIYAFLLVLVFCGPAKAELQLPALFSNGMVLQRQKPIAIWGWVQPGEKVIVKIQGESYSISADSRGKFLADLPSLEAGGPIEITIEATRQKIIKKISNVLIGEVWLASGQSNMAWTVAKSDHFSREKESALDEQLRVFTVGSNPNAQPQSDCKGSWKTSNPGNVGNFSGAAYFMARKLRKELGVPVGMIVSAVGGTDICAWTSYDPQLKQPEIKAAVLDKWSEKDKKYDPEMAEKAYETELLRHKQLTDQAKENSKTAPRAPQKPVQPRLDRNHPGNLFNGMISPLIPYTIRGVIWYQGEANTTTEDAAKLYEIQLALLIADWRKRFGKGDFPFAWVQLPNYGPERAGWVRIRQSMENCLAMHNTGMIVTIDIGNPKDVHPTNKQDVGHRLALWSMAMVYGKPVEHSGPVFKAVKIKDEDLILEFSHGNGLKTQNNLGTVKGFEMAWEEGNFLPEPGRISNDRVILKAKNGMKPVSIRYAWQANPDANLQNRTGLPARPFLVNPRFE